MLSLFPRERKRLPQVRVYVVATTSLENDVLGYIPHDEDRSFSDVEDTDDLGEQAGRLCYLSWERPNPKTATNEGYLKNIIDQGHFSVLEHSSVTFYIDGVSRSLLTELERHRHFSYSVVSQRYVSAHEFGVVSPPLFNEDLTEMLNSEYQRALRSYDYAVEVLMEKGYSRKEARGAARAFLPEATETRILLTGNLRAFREFIPKRESPGADAEIRELASKIRTSLLEISPNSFQDFKED
jgi:thymidylate synthase (FAD)